MPVPSIIYPDRLATAENKLVKKGSRTSLFVCIIVKHKPLTPPGIMASRLLTPTVVRLAQRPLLPRISLSSHHRKMVTVTKTAAGFLPDVSAILPNSTSSSVPVPAIVTDDISISQSCINRIQALVRKRRDAVTLKDIYLRVFVDAGGCSGFQYKFELTQDKDEPINPKDDIIYVADETRVVIDTASLDLIRGSTIDFTQEMIKSSFAVTNNPQSESACGYRYGVPGFDSRFDY